MPDCLSHRIMRCLSQTGWVFCAGLPCPSHTAIAEHMLAAVSDPMMSRCLINHVDRKGPYAGTARVSIWLPCRPSAKSLMRRVFSSNPALATIVLLMCWKILLSATALGMGWVTLTSAGAAGGVPGRCERQIGQQG